MKKRLLSLLMAMCLMATMVPAAFAAESDQPDTITLPNGEVREIPTFEEPEVMPASVSSLEQDAEGYYIIANEEDFHAVTQPEWYANYKFRIKGDLDLSGFFSGTEWTGAIRQFRGVIEGVKDSYDGAGTDERYPVISGIPNNCFMIYGMIGGEISNLIFDHGTNAAFISFLPIETNAQPNDLKMTNVTVKGDISLTGADQSNYSPFVYAAPKSGMTMTNCVNEADISGNIYGSVFHGYYALYSGASSPYKFIDCENRGNITMQYAGMFFGNSSNIESLLTQNNLYLTISGCKNAGTIRGTSDARYLAAPVSNFGTQMNQVEKVLNPSEISNTTAAVPSNIDVEKIGGNGMILFGPELDGFNAELQGDSIAIVRANNEDNVAKYRVSVSTYVSLWYPALGQFYGSDRVTVYQEFTPDEMSSELFVPELKAYGFADMNYGDEGSSVAGYDTRYGSDGNTYYVVDNETQHGNGEFQYFVSSEVVDGVPVGGGKKESEIITVEAYGADGKLLDSVRLR